MKNLFKKVDKYASTYDFNFGGGPMKSVFGGVISVTSLLTVIAISWYYFHSFLNGETYTMDTRDSLDLNEYEISKTGDILIAFNFFDGAKIVSELPYAKTELTYVSEGKETTLSTKSCNEVYDNKFVLFDSMTCIDESSLVEPIKLPSRVNGKFPTQYIKIKVRPCTEAESCATSDKQNPPEIDQADHFIRFYFRKHTIDTKDVSDPIKSFSSYQQGAIKTDKLNIVDFIHKQIIFTNTYDLLAVDVKSDDILSLERADKQEVTRRNSDSFFESTIFLHEVKRTYNRKFMGISDLLAKIGGFASLCFQVGGVAAELLGTDQKKKKLFRSLFEKQRTDIDKEIKLSSTVQVKSNSLNLEKVEKSSENKEEMKENFEKLKTFDDQAISLSSKRIFLRNVFCCLKYNKEDDIVFRKCNEIFANKMDLRNYFRMDARVEFLLSSLMTEEEKCCFKSQKIEIDNNKLEISDRQVEKAKKFFADKIRSDQITEREIEAFNAMDNSEKLQVYNSI